MFETFSSHTTIFEIVSGIIMCLDGFVYLEFARQVLFSYLPPRLIKVLFTVPSMPLIIGSSAYQAAFFSVIKLIFVQPYLSYLLLNIP